MTLPFQLSGKTKGQKQPFGDLKSPTSRYIRTSFLLLFLFKTHFVNSIFFHPSLLFLLFNLILCLFGWKYIERVFGWRLFILHQFIVLLMPFLVYHHLLHQMGIIIVLVSLLRCPNGLRYFFNVWKIPIKI